MEIASNAAALRQLFSMIHYNRDVAELAVSVIVTLAYTPETHCHITQVNLLESLVSYSVFCTLFDTDVVEHLQ